MATWQCPQEWSEWVEWLGAGLHGRCRWRLPILLGGILFATGRRTVASWLRAAGISTDWSDYYYFIAAVGRKIKPLATRLLLLLLRRLPTGDRILMALDDTPTKRYGPKVQGAGIHHNPTPGPADAQFLYGHIWVTLAWVVADGAYAKRPFLKPLRTLGIVVVSRLRKDAALYDLPRKLKKGQGRGGGRPPTYGKNRLSLAKRAAAKRGWQTIECLQYNKVVSKQYKTFLATYHPACGMIRVVMVQVPEGCEFFFSTDPEAGVQEILEAFADRSAIEQIFHDIKEVWGAGKQQLRYLWANIGAYHLNLWMHTLVELWAWNKSKAQICNRRDSPWDDPGRRPSHADRRKALQRSILQREYSSLLHCRGPARKLASFAQQLLKLAM